MIKIGLGMLLDKNYTLHKPKAIIFDWDNTLVDSWQLIYEAMKSTFIEFNRKPWTLAEVKINIHRSVKDTLPAMFPKNWEKVAQAYRDSYISLRQRLKPLSGAEKTLSLIQKKGIYAAVVSNKKSNLLVYEVKQFGWEKYFKIILGSGDLAEDKPSPITVHEALKHTTIQAGNEVWFVGDSVTDMETAYNSSCVPVFFGEDDYTSSRYSHCKPKVYFANHKDLFKYLESIYSN